MKKLLFVLLVLASGMTISFAQVKRVVADKIIAQVGDKIVLHSDIINAISDFKRQGEELQLPPNPECSFLEGQLIQKALVLQAEKDSLPVTDDEVDAALDNQIRGFIQSYGSREVLEEVAGRSVYQLKEDFRAAIRERKLADAMRAKILENIKVSPIEVKAFYDKIPKDSLPFLESEIEVSQIVVQPKSNVDVDEYIIKQLYDYKRQVESGAKKFDQLAKLNSDDPAVKENGGQYSLNRNDKIFDPAFLAASFKLKEGQISPVIKSKFGYHIIQMVSRSGDDAVVRHILKIPPVTDGEIQLGIQKLDSIRSKLIDRSLNFGEAVEKFSDDENSKFTGGAIQNRMGSSYLAIDQLPDKDLVLAIKNLKPGDYSKPQVFVNEKQVKAVRLILLKSRSVAHRENMKDDYNRIAQQALDEKKGAILQKWFHDHLSSYYIWIDRDFANCSVLADWWKFSAKN